MRICRLMLHVKLRRAGFSVFTAEDAARVGETKQHQARKSLNRLIARGLLYRTNEPIRLNRRINPQYLYSMERSTARRFKIFQEYAVKRIGDDFPEILPAYEAVRAGGVHRLADLGADYQLGKDRDMMHELEKLGLISAFMDGGGLYFYDPRRTSEEAAKARVNEPNRRERKEYDSIQEMIAGGFCFDHYRNITKIPQGARIGICDDDIVMTPDEIKGLISGIEPENHRDRILFKMLFTTGSRITQNLRIKVSDVDHVKSRVYVNAAKLGIPIYRNLPSDFLQEIAEYVDYYGLQPEDYLFCVDYSRRNAGRGHGRGYSFNEWVKRDEPISRRIAWDRFNRYALKAGVQYQYIDDAGFLRWRLHPHSSKKTVVSKIYEITHDSMTAALSVGNKSPKIIEAHYIRVQTATRHKAADAAVKALMGGPEPTIEIKEIMIELERRAFHDKCERNSFAFKPRPPKG